MTSETKKYDDKRKLEIEINKCVSKTHTGIRQTFAVLVITVSVLVLVLSLLSSCYCVVCSRSVWQLVAGGCCVSVLVITVSVLV